jgi:hypothetical protein
VGVDHTYYIEKLRERKARKVAERTLAERMRHAALEPIEEFAQSMAEAGEISGFRTLEDRFACALLVNPHMESVLSTGGSIQVTCNYAHPARNPGQTFWGLSVEAIGCKPRFFSGTDDYRDLFTYLVACIAEQKLANVAPASGRESAFRAGAHQ